MERECVCLGGEIERGNKKETHRYKYRYYIVLYNQPRSILTIIPSYIVRGWLLRKRNLK
jgi:hypothetical protein